MFEHDVATKLEILSRGLHAAGAAIVLVVVAAGYVLVFRPLDRRIEARQSRCEELEARVSNTDSLRAEQKQLAGRLAALDRQTVLLAKRVPDEPVEAEFLSQAAAAAAQVGLKIRDYRPGAVSARENCSQMEIQFSCAGPYGSLCRFLERLGSLDRLWRITRAEIAAAGPEGCTMNATMVLFFGLKKPADAAPRGLQPGGTKHG